MHQILPTKGWLVVCRNASSRGLAGSLAVQGWCAHLLPVEAATVVFGQGSEGGAHLPAL